MKLFIPALGLLVLAGCEMPAGLEELGALQTAVASEFAVVPDRVNVSTMTGADGTELRVVFQNAEMSVDDAELCNRVAQVVSTTYPSANNMDRIAVGMASRVGVGPVGATSQRGVCVMERNATPEPVPESMLAPDSLETKAATSAS